MPHLDNGMDHENYSLMNEAQELMWLLLVGIAVVVPVGIWLGMSAHWLDKLLTLLIDGGMGWLLGVTWGLL